MMCPHRQQIFEKLYFCTRDEGHEGHHQCHRTHGQVVAEWWDDEEGHRHIRTPEWEGRGIK